MTRSSNTVKLVSLMQRLRTVANRLGAVAEPPEDSRLLRGLVQLLVSFGIASISVAAAGIVQASPANLLAIPLSALGGYWSWKSRRRSNVTVKFLIAFGMLTALGIFLARLLGDSGDTRIRLAELLIQLQVLHSFDMPRRKDLGYSIVIGLILLGVAATLSQTLTLGPILAGFLAIALPVLVLDYRSRLGAWPVNSAGAGSALKLPRLAGLLLAVVGLGLAIFVAMPRLPGYQIRTFPVSDTISFQGEFSGDRIFNSGYVTGEEFLPEDSADGDAAGLFSEGNPLNGPGEMSGSSYYGFNQRINQNLRGAVTPQVMMRVRSQAPGFWRVLAFDRYTGQGWEISGNEDQTEVLERSPFSYKTRLPIAAYKTGEETAASRQREVVQTYTIVNDFPNLIPVLYKARDLYFPTRSVAIDPEGSLRAPVALSKGLTFTAISGVPYRDRTLLGTASTRYSADTRTAYLQVPPAIKTRVQQQTEALLASAPAPLKNPYESALFLAQALKQNYTIQETPFLEPDEDLVEAFLFRYGGGYPDHFSTVLTVMLRSIGIPARLVTGFSPGRFNPFTGYYVVSNTDAHAVTEVYFPDYGWFAFDPIPGHEVVPLSIRDSQTFGVLRQLWHWVAGWLPSPVSAWLVDGVTLVLKALAGILGIFRRGVWGIIGGLLGATALAWVGWLTWKGWRQWRWQMRLRRLPTAEQAYRQLLAALARRGYPKRPSQTPLEYGQALCQTPQVTDADQVMAVIQAYLRWRYGHQAVDGNGLKRTVRAIARRRST